MSGTPICEMGLASGGSLTLGSNKNGVECHVAKHLQAKQLQYCQPSHLRACSTEKDEVMLPVQSPIPKRNRTGHAAAVIPPRTRWQSHREHLCLGINIILSH